MRINNCMELLNEWSDYNNADNEKEAREIMKRRVYKHTLSGCIFEAEDDGVTVCGYAEGAIGECAPYYLEWGFEFDDFLINLNEADADGEHEWDKVNNWRYEA
jgi:hypothetical protein